MSFIVHDLRCPQGHVEISATYRVSDGPPACPTCQEPRAVFYATHDQARTAVVHVFKEYEIDGGVKITSPEGELRYRQEIAKKQGVSVDQVVITGRGNVGERVDELRHRAIQGRRASGMDERDFKRYKDDVAHRERKNDTPRVGWRP